RELLCACRVFLEPQGRSLNSCRHLPFVPSRRMIRTNRHNYSIGAKAKVKRWKRGFWMLDVGCWLRMGRYTSGETRRDCRDLVMSSSLFVGCGRRIDGGRGAKGRRLEVGCWFGA